MVLISDTELSGPHSGAWELPLLRLMSENGTFDGLLKHGSNLSPNSFCTSMGKIKVYTSIPHSPYPKTSFQCLILHQNGRVQKLWFCKPIIINVPMPRHIFLTNSPYFTFPYFIMPPNHVIILHSRISFSHTQFPIFQVLIPHSHTSSFHIPFPYFMFPCPIYSRLYQGRAGPESNGMCSTTHPKPVSSSQTG